MYGCECGCVGVSVSACVGGHSPLNEVHFNKHQQHGILCKVKLCIKAEVLY